jgi:serine/threonine protein kinase
VEALEKPVAGAEIDGYRLVRPIGQGGFGTVWLCWSDASRGYHALKWVAGDAGGLKLELDALRKFREISQKLRSPNLIAIEHINLLSSGLIYTLPLADGMEGNDPSVESWRPMTLADRIEGGSGFSSAEILQIILPIIRATADLNGEGLVHRDIKPGNILFFGGVPCLADMGLLANDSASLTQRGTPGFLPPSWYLESAGQPDMWGLATTLYTLLTGNNPDKMGRPKFLWPPAGKDSLSPAEQDQWKRLHAVVYRATHEKPAERFRDFQTFAAAVENAGGSEGAPRKKRGIFGFVLAGVVLASVLAWVFLARDRQPHSPTPTDSGAFLTFKTPEPPSTPEQGISAARQQELDNEAAAITKKLEGRKANSTGELQSFRERAAAVTKKMQAFAPKSSPTDGLKESMAKTLSMLNRGGGTDAESKERAIAEKASQGKAAAEKALKAKQDETALLEIRDELQSLVKKLPTTTLQQEMEAVNRLYQSLVDAAYAKTATADEKFYFNDHVRPRLEQEFQRIFKWKPGIYPYDTTAVNLELALASPKWSTADKTVMAEIQSAVSQIKKRLDPK